MQRIVSTLLDISYGTGIGNIIDSTNTNEITKTCTVFYLILNLLVAQSV